jgi:hypothetical protein
MNDLEQKRFNQLYQRHVLVLKLRGYHSSNLISFRRCEWPLRVVSGPSTSYQLSGRFREHSGSRNR